MTLLFKISGFILIIFTTFSIGFLKSSELGSRYKKLESIQKGIGELKERIRMGGGEIDRLLNSSFHEYPIDYSHLEKDDVEILNDFFSNVGLSDTKAEYERCEVYINLLKNKIEEANAKYHETARLYKSIGLLSGVFLCIFFI